DVGARERRNVRFAKRIVLAEGDLPDAAPGAEPVLQQDAIARPRNGDGDTSSVRREHQVVRTEVVKDVDGVEAAAGGGNDVLAVAGAEVVLVIAESAIQDVVARAALQDVIACPAVEPVVAAGALEAVVKAVAVELVVQVIAAADPRVCSEIE